MTLTDNALLSSLPLFKGVEGKIIADLLATAHLARADKGKVFLTQGENLARYYLVLEGWCGAARGNHEGQETIVEIYRSGDFLLEPGRDTPVESSPFHFQALTPVALLLLAPQALRVAFDQSPVLMRNVLAASVQRCQALRDHIEQLTLHNAEQRVGHFLLHMRLYAEGKSLDLSLPFDKAHIASYLGIKPETLSRTLQVFKDKGFMIHRHTLTLPHQQALCDYCDASTMESCRHAHTADCSFGANNGDITF